MAGISRRLDASRGSATHVAAFNALLLLVFAVVLLSGAASPARAQSTQPSTAVTPSALESQAVPRSAQATANSEPNVVSWPKLALSLLIVLGLIVGLKYLAQWMFPGVRIGAQGRGVRVLSRTPIAPRQQVLLLHVGRRVLVVGESSGSLSPLASIDEPDEVAELLGQTSSTAPATASSRFRAMFGRAEREYDTSPESFTAADDLPAADDGPDGRPSDEPTDPNIAATKNEIDGLLDRMRSLTKAAGGKQK